MIVEYRQDLARMKARLKKEREDLKERNDADKLFAATLQHARTLVNHTKTKLVKMDEGTLDMLKAEIATLGVLIQENGL